MMNSERNSASPASTWFGGMLLSPIAFRVIASTTKILVNDDIMSSSAGATESSVMPSRTTIDVDGAPSGPLIWIEMSPGVGVGTGGTVGAIGAAAAISGTTTESTTPARTAAPTPTAIR